ncbi:hypothetical protein HKD37_14G040217 [Glycine soja]
MHIVPTKQTDTSYRYLTLTILRHFLKCDALPRVNVTNRVLALMNEVKTIFPESTNLLCQFHIDKNVKTKCKTLVGKKCMGLCHGNLREFGGLSFRARCLKKFEIACSPWPMFVDYVKQIWLISHKERFVKAWTNKALKRLLQNSLGDLCSVLEAMNHMITLQHTEIKASFETSTHVVGHVSLNQIDVEHERVSYAGIDSSRCGCAMRTTHGLPCACELARYVVGSIPLGVIHMFWLRLSFSNQGLYEPEVSITEEMETISKRFEELDACGKVTLKSKLREIAYPDLKSINSLVKRSASSSKQAKPRRTMPMLDQFHPCIHDSIENLVDVKADDNCGYRAIAILFGMGEDSWFLIRNHLLKELAKWFDEYINLLGGIERFEELKQSLLVDGLSMVYKYNVILVSLSLQQSMTFFPLRSQPPTDCYVHRIICIGHLYDNHFVQVFLRDHCLLPPVAFLWSTHCHYQAKQWPTPYISRM